MTNTLESIRKDCSIKGWNGYDAEPISEKVLENAAKLEDVLSLGQGEWELFPTGRNSVQYQISKPELNNIYSEIEVYEEKIEYFRSENKANSFAIQSKQCIEYTFENAAKFIEWCMCDSIGCGD